MCHNETAAPEPDEPNERGRQIVVDGGTGGVPVLVVEPGAADADPSSAPLVVLATDIYGVNPFYRYLASRLASSGYRVAIPDLFHRIGPAADTSRDAALARRRLLDDVQAITDLEIAVGTLAGGTAGARPGPYAMFGFCLGGSLALLTAAAHPEQCTITYYAFPRGAPGALVAAPEPLAVAAAVAGPVLAFWGRQDYIDASEVGELTSALDQARGETEVIWYDQAGHSFLAGLTTKGAESEAAEDSWRRSMAFLARHLPSPTTAGPGSAAVPPTSTPKET